MYANDRLPDPVDMDETHKAEFRKLEDAGYLNGIREFAMARSAPFFWSAQMVGDRPRLLRNGTISRGKGMLTEKKSSSVTFSNHRVHIDR